MNESHTPPGSAKIHDVRMRGFPHRTPVADVTELLSERAPSLPTETVNLHHACGRVVGIAVTSEVSVPGFRRAAMDGYAVCGEETFSAGQYNPIDLEIVGQALPGKPHEGGFHRDQAVRIMTGSPVPDLADSVLQAEAAEEIIQDSRPPLVRITAPVAPGKNVGQIGEDIPQGSVVVSAGRVLRPQDVGVLASIGAASVTVVCQPRVQILVTGEELLPSGSKPVGYQIVDSNSVMLEGLVRRDGGVLLPTTLLGDDPQAIREALSQSEADVILVSGGSSVGVEDHAPRLVAELGELAVHGVALRPASPLGVGFLGNRVVFLLPGNPVSCLCGYDLFAGQVIRQLGGRHSVNPYPRRRLPLVSKMTSAIGRTDYVRVRITQEGVVPLAISGASILSSTTRADGFVLVPMDLEGYPPGETVEVSLYDIP